MEPPIIVTCVLLMLGLAPRMSGMAKAMGKQPASLVVSSTHNTTKCYSKRFSKELCGGDRTIEITDAVYGVSRCNADPTHCCPDPGDCTIPVEEANPDDADHPDYHKEILIACNNKQKCADLKAQWITNIYMWCPGAYGTSDYVTLHYMCLTEAERRTTTTTRPGFAVSTATVVSTGTNVTDDDDDDDDDDDEDNDSTRNIVIIAVIVVVVVAVVVAVTVCMVCRKRKANSRPEEDKTAAAQSRSGIMTSHASACVDDVDPYHTARPGGGPGPPEPQPAKGLNDVTKPATNPSDTGQPLTEPMVTKEPKPDPKAVDKPNIGADLHTEVVRVRPRKNVVLDRSPGEEDVEANNNGSDMTEVGDRASYDLVMHENHGYGTRHGLGGDREGEGHGVDGEGLPHDSRQDGDQDEQTDSDYDLVMTENNAYN